MKATLLRTITEDNLHLEGLLYEPTTKTDEVVLHIHGMSGNFYENFFLDAMVQKFNGVSVSLFAAGTRGTGMINDIMVSDSSHKWRRLGAAYEIFEDSIMDIEVWVRVLIKQGFKKIYLQGHSLGESKIVYYQSQKKNNYVKGLILLSATEMICYAEANPDYNVRTEEARKLINKDKGEQLLSQLVWEDKFILSADTYINFTTRNNPIDVFKAYDVTKEAPIGTINVPMLAIMGKQDGGPRMIGGSVEDYLKLLKSKSKKCPDFQYFIPDTTHGYFKHETEVAEHIANWLKEL